MNSPIEARASPLSSREDSSIGVKDELSRRVRGVVRIRRARRRALKSPWRATNIAGNRCSSRSKHRDPEKPVASPIDRPTSLHPFLLIFLHFEVKPFERCSTLPCVHATRHTVSELYFSGFGPGVPKASNY